MSILWCELGGVRVAYTRRVGNHGGSGGSGGSGGREVLYIHGNTGGKLWFEQVMELPGCAVTALDMPNFGCSEHIEQTSIDVYAEYIALFIQQLGLLRPVTVGHSLGGAVAMALSVRYPELIGPLVLVDSCGPDGLHTPVERYPAIEAYSTSAGRMKRALAAVVPTLDDEAMLDRLVACAQKMNPAAFIGHARALGQFSVRGLTADFAQPVLVLHGAQDIIISQATAQETADAYPNARLELLPDVGHSVMVERPAVFRSLLLEFIKVT